VKEHILLIIPNLNLLHREKPFYSKLNYFFNIENKKGLSLGFSFYLRYFSRFFFDKLCAEL